MLQLFSSFNAQELFFHFNTVQDDLDGVDKTLSDGGVEDRGSKLDDRILKPALVWRHAQHTMAVCLNCGTLVMTIDHGR